MSKHTILISSARSGTNYFLSVYGRCYQNDFVVKEIFRRGGDSLLSLEELLQLPRDAILSKVESSPGELWQMIRQRCDSQSRRAIAKIFYYHAPVESSLWTQFYESTRIVHLIRRSAFDTFLSREIAVKTGQWQKFAGRGCPHPKLDRLRLDPCQLSEFIMVQKEQVSRIREMYVGGDYHEIFYEDIAESVERCVFAISEVFGQVDSERSISIELQKQKGSSNADLVSNYEEVAYLDTYAF